MAGRSGRLLRASSAAVAAVVLATASLAAETPAMGRQARAPTRSALTAATRSALTPHPALTSATRSAPTPDPTLTAATRSALTVRPAPARAAATRAAPAAPAAATRPLRAIPAREPHPAALSSQLADLVRAHAGSEPVGRRAARRAVGAATLATRPVPHPMTQVSISLASPDGAQASLDAIEIAGGRLLNHSATMLEAEVPIASLERLAAIDGIDRIEPIRLIRTHAFTSTGVATHGADAWHQAGYHGEGVRIGIIDGGFAGISDLLASEFPGGVQARCYSTVGVVSSSLAACEGEGEAHGTAVAETVADMAPAATLYLANPISYLDERETVAWMRSQGVRIINASFGSTAVFEGPGDGTSQLGNSFYSVLDAAVRDGALWVNSAGNSGDLGWTGPWVDANANGWLEFSGGDEANSMSLAAGQSVDIAIRWSDPWGGSANDYDLYLFRAGATDPVARSTDDQAGTGDPVERLSYSAVSPGTYEIQIARHDGAAVDRIQLLVESDDGGLAYQVPDGTLPSPADSSNPGMLSVGAVQAGAPDTIEPYSSRGPTVDGRTKPDLVAVDCAGVTSIAGFCGTSQSAPFVSGAAALLLQADPALTPAGLAQALLGRATPLGSPVPNNTFGWGRLALGPAPTTGAPPVPQPPAPGPPPLGLKAVSSPGTALTWRGMATSGTTTVHLAFGNGMVDGDAVAYRRSFDGGATFGEEILLSTVGTPAGFPAIASAGGTVHAAWLEGDLGGVGSVGLWYRSSADSGVTWGAPRPLSPVDGRAGNPGIASDAAGRVVVSWTDGETGRVYAVASGDGGATFASPRAIGSTTLSPFTSLADRDGLPAVAVGSGGRVLIAWSTSPTRVVVRSSADGGASWLPVRTIDTLANGYSRPWLSAYGAGVAVAYGAHQTPGSATGVYVRRSTDGGTTWQPRRRVSSSATLDAFDPAVTAKGPVVRVAYAQCTTRACTRSRIWYRQSANGGTTWSTAAALTGSSTYAYPTGLAATSRILVLYDALTESSADTGTAYLRIR